MTTALAKMDPQALVTMALEKGATIDVVERMVALAKEIRAEQARGDWHRAMVQFHQDCPPIRKDSTAQIGNRYAYTYASLPAVLDTVEPVLAKCGLMVSWLAAEAPAGHVGVRCIVAHESGHREESGPVCVPIEASQTGASHAQRVGIAHTYARRYALYTVLGIAPDDDDDAQGAPPALRRQKPRETDPFADERDRLLVQIGELADAQALSKDVRAALWKERFGDRKPADVTPAELADLLAYMRGERADGAA
jgi:hypothetical protein